MDNNINAADMLDTLPVDVPELTLGWEALAWAAKYLKHPNGIRAGESWKFTPRQARFVLWYYAVDNTGRFIYGGGMRRLAKGSGKSPFAAALALIELLAPVRFSHFDPNVIGGCVGKPVAMPWVQIAACSLAQTENTMRMVRAMVNKPFNPAIHERYNLDVGKMQINVVPEGKLEVLTSSAATAEGAEATFIIGDELEHWLPSNGGVEFYNTLLDNLSKSGSRMVGTLNAWKPGVGSVGEKAFLEWVDYEEGRVKKKSLRWLMDVIQAPPNTDLADEQSLRGALEYVYKDCPWADIDTIMSRIWSSQSNVDDSRRKYLNWPTAAADAWVDPQDWQAMAKPDRQIDPAEEVVMFFDGSLSGDTTALVGCCMSDGHVFLIGHWSPADMGGTVDAHTVDRRVQWAFDTYNVVAFFADVREWESFTKITWPDRYKDKLVLWAIPSGKQPEPIAWDMRTKLFDFTRAVELTGREIIERSFTHDGSAILSAHVRNCHRVENRYGVSIKKESPSSARKIDAAVCMVGARMVRRLVAEVTPQSTYDGAAVFW